MTLLTLLMNQPWPLPDDNPFYANVGRVASEWAHLEHGLDVLIWRMAGIEYEKCACITAQLMGVGPRCKVIITLGGRLGLSDDPVLKGFRQLMGKSFTKADARARIVHDPWYLQTARNTVGQFKAMPYSDQRYGVHDVTQEEIEEIIGEIRELRREVARLSELALAELVAKEAKVKGE